MELSIFVDEQLRGCVFVANVEVKVAVQVEVGPCGSLRWGRQIAQADVQSDVAKVSVAVILQK